MQIRLDEVGVNTHSGNDFRTTTPNPAWPAPERTIAEYYDLIGQPGGYQLTTDGFLKAVAQYQRKGTWNDLLMAESVNDFIREGFGQAMLGSAYADGVSVPRPFPLAGLTFRHL
jgi:hypothetical protein